MDLAGQIAIYGGSFNPPHMGHQMACLYLLEALGAKAVWLVPAFKHPLGKELAPYEHRLEMCRLLAEPFGSQVVEADVERKLGGDGRTYDTLVHLISHYPRRRFALAVGSDILGEKGQWHRWKDIKKMVNVAVLRRGGFPVSGQLTGDLELPEVASSAVRERLAAGASVEGLIPRSVAGYCAAHGLYSS